MEPGTGRFLVALVGAAMAATGVIVLLGLSVSLASASSVSITEIQNKKLSYKKAREILNAPANGFLAGHNDLAALASAAGAAFEQERAALESYVQSPSKDLENKLRAGRLFADWYRGRLQLVADVGSYQRLRWRFFVAAVAMGFIAFVTAAGILMYVAAVSLEDPPSALVFVEPHELVSVLAPDDAAGRARFAGLLGCDVDQIDALVVGGKDGSAEVVTLPDEEEGCRSVTLTVRERDGDLVAEFEQADPETGEAGD